MRRFIVEVVIDALLLSSSAVPRRLLGLPAVPVRDRVSAPIVALRGAGIVGFLSSAAVLVLVNRFARPVLVALTGRLLFSTMGFFVVIINAIAIWITSFFAPIKIGIVARPGVAVDHRRGRAVHRPVHASSTPCSASIGRIARGRPQHGHVGTSSNRLPDAASERDHREPAPPAGLQRDLHDQPRHRAGRDAVGEVRRWFARGSSARRTSFTDATGPQRIRAMLQQLGPTYVKIGQMMASRSDILPPEWITELSKLQSEAGAVRLRGRRRDRHQGARRAARGALRDVRPRAVRRGVDGAGPPRRGSTTGRSSRSRSSGRGSWPRRRPTWASSRSSPASPSGASRSLARSASGAIVAEFAQGVLKELDYRNEAYHARRLADGMQRFPEIHVPLVYDELSGQRVITMEFVNGIKISKADELRAAGFDTAELGTVFIRAIIKQVLVDGFFHGDPHPGNILADPSSKQIIFLDLGLVGQLNPQQRVDLLGLIYAIKEIDIPGIGDGLLALGKPTPRLRRSGLPRRHRSARPPVPDLRQGRLARARRSGAFLGAVFNNGLRLDSQLTLAMKAVIQAEETARALSFDIDLGEAAVTEARAALLESFTPGEDPEAAPGQRRPDRQGARRASVPSLESAALQWLDQFNKGKFVVEVDTKGLEKSIVERQRHRPPGDRRGHRGRPADRHRDRDGDPAPAVADPVPGRRLPRDDRVRASR